MKKYWNKYTRAIFFFLVGAVLVITAFTMNQAQIDSQVQTKRIIVTKENVEPYGELKKENLEFKDVVISEVPDDAIMDQKSIQFGDAFASKFGFVQGTPIRSSYITDAKTSKLGSAIGLKKGRVEIGVKTDLVLSAGNEIRPGILVDAQAFITNGSEGRGIRKVDPDLKGLLVKKVTNSEGMTPDSESTNNNMVPAAITLEVAPEQAARIMEYQETGKVYLLPAGVK
ncbi:Flp pilus assembly protein CpaB [Paenibacillus polymyxa]|uniref:Flp pilus assembly protein CpaB n=1 Tax=Paenibacillus polymyxa TaxID=1406 RepID=UPI0011189E48|nr:RcpC/CpaB family pilus assembly protein [Paenibacillus polymyxa]QDA30208.1 hypothetical protein FGY93_25145 [Paenibacillus polymyxa]